MFGLNSRVLGLAAAALIAVPAFAATPATSPGATSSTGSAAANSGTPAEKTADRDFGQYSRDGAQAFAEIDMARLAIFDGQTSKAQQDVKQAEAMLAKAKSDASVYTKAESELKVPAGTAQRGPANATPSTTQITWLPVGGSMIIDEDYTANKTKTAGVAKADAEVKQGNSKQALETLKLHDVNVSFLEQVAPLDATLKGVEQAASLMAGNHYFAANQALKTVDDSVRIDEQSYDDTPSGKTASAQK